MSYFKFPPQSKSVGNSTAQTLSADATYTGTWETTEKSSAQIWVVSTQAATLFIEFSPDGGTTTDQFPFGGVTLTANIPYYTQVSVGMQSFRIRVTDTSSSSNDIITMVGYGEFAPQTSMVSTGVGVSSPATVTKAVSYGCTPNENFAEVKEGDYHSAFTTNTPLAADAVFDSGIQDISGFTQLWTEISSDVSGTLVGTWYDDAAGTNVLRTFTAPYVPTDNLFYSTTVVLGQYLRYTFTNDSTLQTRFHMRVKLDSRAYSGQMLKVDSFIPSNVLAALTRSVLVGKDLNDVYRNALVNSGNALVVGDFFTEVALGNVPNYEKGSKFGRNPLVNTGVSEDVWQGGGLYTGQPDGFTPETVDVVSDDANDTSAGTGARTIRLFGLQSSSSTEYTSEDITLNGTTAVTSVNTWWRINRAMVLTAGTADQNEGIITINSTTTTANVFAQIGGGLNQSTIAAYTVPAGHSMIINRIFTAITRNNGSAGSAFVTLRARESGGVYRAIRVMDVQTGSVYDEDTQGGLILPAGTDIKFRVESVSDNSTFVNSSFDYTLLTL